MIGAVAMGMVLVDIAKGIEKFALDAADLGRELGGSWLDGAIAKMTSLGDAIKQADKNADQMAKDRDADRDRQREIAVETATITGGKKAGDTLRAQQLQDDIDSLEKEKVLDLQTKQFYKDKAENPDELSRVGSQGISGYRVQEKNSADQYNTALSHQNTLLAEKAKLIKEAERPDKEKKEKDAYNPYAGLIQDARLYKKLQEDIARGEDEATTAFGKQIAEEAEAVKRADEQEIKAGEEWHRQERVKQEAIAETTQASLRDAEEQQAIAERVIAFRERMGLVSPRGAATESADVSKAAQKAQVDVLSSQQATIDPNTSPEAAARWQKIEDEKTQISQKGAAQREQIAQQEAEREQQVFAKVFQQMTGPLNTFVDYFLTHTHRMGEAFARMGDQMALALVNDLLRMAEKWVEHEAFKTLQHILGNTQRTSADAAAAAAAKAIQSTTAVAMVTSDAAVAAAGTLAYYSAFAPEIAPGLAAAQFALTESYAGAAAFESGTDYVPRTGMAMLHEGERVSTRPENEAISKALSGPKSGGNGDSHFHYSPNISGIDGASVAGMARQHGNVFFRQAYRQMRVMGRAQ